MSQRARSEAESGVREENPAWNPTPVENIDALTASELAEVAPAQRGLQSGAFVKRADGSSALDWSSFKGPPPSAAAPPGAERAELQISDYSLQFANPFVGSSLQPPPPRKRPWLKPLLVTVAGAALLAAGYAGALYHQQTNALPQTIAATTAPIAPASTTRAPVVENVTPAEVATTAVLVAPATTATQPAEVREVAPATPVVTTPATSDAAKPAKSAKAEKPRVAARTRGRGRAAQPAAAAPAAPDSVVSVEVSTVAPAAPKVEAKGSATQLKQLSRTQVKAGLEAVRSSLNSCASGARGEIMANVTISGAGRVSYASIEGAFAGTPQGSCMARALRGAQFPSFTSPQFLVRYPFVF